MLRYYYYVYWFEETTNECIDTVELRKIKTSTEMILRVKKKKKNLQKTTLIILVKL